MVTPSNQQTPSSSQSGVSTVKQVDQGTIADAKAASALQKKNDTLAVQKTAEQKTAEADSRSKNKERSPDKRFKYYIQVKFGGDSTGQLPTQATTDTAKPDANTAAYLAETLKVLGGRKDLIAIAELAASWENAKKTPSAQPTSGSTASSSTSKTTSTPGSTASSSTSKPTEKKSEPTNKDIVVSPYLKTENFKKSPSTSTAAQQKLPTFNTGTTNTAISSDSLKTAQIGVTEFKGIKLEDFQSAAKPVDQQAELENLPRELTFTNLNGDFLGRTEIRLSTANHNTAKFVLHDPKDQYRNIIPKLKNVEIVLGFVEGYKRNVFVGVVLSVGRVFPNGTLVEVIDPSYDLKTPAPNVAVTNLAADSSTPTPPIQGAATDPAQMLKDKKAAASPSSATTPTTQNTTANTAKPADSKSASSTIPAGSIAPNPNQSPQKASTTQQTPTAGTQQTPATQTPTTSTALGSTPPTGTDLLTEIQKSSSTQSLGQKFVSSSSTNLKFSDKTNPLTVQKMGQIQLQQAKLSAASAEAALKGNVLVVRGNTMSEVSPGQGESSGIILDYKGNPAAFIGSPIIKKRSEVHLQGPAGGVQVRGWNPQTKQLTEGVAYTPATPVQHPTGIIKPPEWSAIKINDPIVPGSPYTWGDATKNGRRVPQSKEIMGGIIRICVIITGFTTKTGQKKWTINSWYRDPVSNRNADGATNSRHLYGDAVDVVFPGYEALFKELWADGQGGSGGWQGGIAAKRGVFMHIDDRGSQGKGRSRWYY
jgi:hypothetical protein